MVLTHEQKYVAYIQKLCSDFPNNVHKLPWGIVAIRNCDEDGNLLTPKSIQDYKTNQKNLWLILELALFRQNNGEFSVWCCTECPSMREIKNLGVQNSEENLRPYICIHSQTMNFLIPNWETTWDVRLTPGAESNSVICNEDISVVTCMNDSKTGLFLAAIHAENKVHLLFTVTERQRAPFCIANKSPQCSTQNCKHYQTYMDTIAAEGYREMFNSRSGRTLQPEHDVEYMNEDEETQVDEGENIENHGVDYATRTVPDDARRERHFQNEMREKEFVHKCGLNFTKIPYPFYKSSNMQTTWLKRINHIYDFPDVFIPEYEIDKKCELHGNAFDDNDDHLIQESENSVVYNESGYQIFDIKVIYRKTVAMCDCRQ